MSIRRYSQLLALSLGSLAGIGGFSSHVHAQPQRPPSPVRYTEARRHTLQRSVQLPGTVQPRITSLVASMTEGVVEELNAREGQRVARGAPLAKLRTTTLELRLRSVEGQLREAEARLELAQSNLQRSKELLASELISRQQHDDDVSESSAWQGRVDQFQAEVASIQDDIERSTIRAPFSGVIVEEHTEVGQWLGGGDVVAELMATADLDVVVDVPERYFSLLKAGSPARVSFESLPGTRVDGKVTAIVPRASDQARTFPVKVRISNREGLIGIGMLADVSFEAGGTYETTIVPKDAIVSRGPQRMVYLLNDDDTVAPVPVETGNDSGAWTGIEGPVQPGQKVITRGNERLQPGQTVAGEPLEYELP